MKRVVTGNRPRPDQLDGVVLALAGLQRLWADPDGRRTIRPLISKLRWMVLPLSLCPAAPGQGALAIECRADDQRCREHLGALHDPETARLVKQELDLVAAEPAEQRQTFGATAVASNACGTLMWVRGCRPSDSVDAGPGRPLCIWRNASFTCADVFATSSMRSACLTILASVAS